MWTNILLKRCGVFTNVAQYNHILCFGYALVLTIKRIFTDLTGVQYLAANENRMINEVSACFKTSGVQYGPVDCTQYHLFLPCLPQNSILIVVDAKDRTKNYYIKVILSIYMILLYIMYVFCCLITIIIFLRRYRRGMASIIIILNVKYNIIVRTLVNQL